MISVQNGRIKILVLTPLRRILVLAVVFSLPACLAINSVVLSESIKSNTDFWWHLRTGAWIAQHHAVPATDPFSTVGRDKLWVAYSWLYEVMLYAFYRWRGMVGTVIFALLILVGLAAALHAGIRRRTGGFAVPVALAAAGLFAMARLYSPRPWLFTFLFFTIELDILFGVLVDQPDSRAQRRLWLLPPLFALWANLHIQFVYGLTVLLLAAAAQHLELLPGRIGLRIVRNSNEHQRLLWLVTATSVVATLFNPYTWRVYQVVLEVSTQRMPFRIITELAPPNFRSPFDYIVAALSLFAAFVLSKKNLRSRLFAWILLIAATLISFRSIRDEWMVVIVALFIIAASSTTRESPPVSSPRIQSLLTAAVVALLILLSASARGLSNAALEQRVTSVFPAKAADMIVRSRFSGPLFNDFAWGGYLIWSLPGLPVSMDSRTNIYGDERLARSIDTFNCVGDWQTDPELTSAHVVIGQVGQCLSSALAANLSYELVYRDETAVVFIKRDAFKATQSSSLSAPELKSHNNGHAEQFRPRAGANPALMMAKPVYSAWE
jgi:hypothetical protein